MRTFRNAAMALAIPGMLAVAAPAGAAVSSHVALAAAAPSQAQVWEHGRHHHDRYYGGGYGRQRYYEAPVYARQNWRGDERRYDCRRRSGTTGLIVGGAGGALLGREIAGRGSRTLGAILGGAGGALLGREIDRGGSRCR
jgi:hypothetical protein